MLALTLVAVLAWLGAADIRQSDPAHCTPWQTCRQLAADAAERGDFEAFHTIAWRAVQSGPPNDAELMFLLARAQSLSGRPHDALVMLRRLADRGIARLEAATLEDFRRVRSLPEWPATLEALQKTGVRPAAPQAPPPPPITASPSMRLPRRRGQAEHRSSYAPLRAPLSPSSALSSELSKSTDAAPLPSAPASTPVNLVNAEEDLRLPEAIGTPVAVAYDAVSGRLVIADESSDTLKIVSRLSKNVVDLVSRGWAGAYRTTAIAIDGRRGDLWVAGADASTGQSESVLQLIQLISGRQRYRVSLPADAGPARFAALAVSANSVFLLDTEGGRIFELVQGGKTLRMRMPVSVSKPASVAVGGEDAVFVTHAGGIVRLDLAGRSSMPVTPANGVDVQGLLSIEHYKGSLLGIQRRTDGTLAAVRIRLDARGRGARAIEVLGPAASAAAAVMNDVFYYLEQQGTVRIVRSFPLR